MSFDIEKIRIGVVGLGYVGLPLAVEFGKRYPTVGFDVNERRVEELRSGRDSTLEVEAGELSAAGHLSYADSLEGIADCNFFIVTVPTPIGMNNRPNLSPLRGRQRGAVRHPQARRYRRLRIDRLPGCNRRILPAVPGGRLGIAGQRRLLYRL